VIASGQCHSYPGQGKQPAVETAGAVMGTKSGRLAAWLTPRRLQHSMIPSVREIPRAW